jgi:hypothetical protein
MSLAPGVDTRNYAPTLPSFPDLGWLRRLNGPREVYALSIDQLWFAVAVALGLLLAGWLIVGAELAPPYQPAPTPAEHLLVL